MSSYTENLKLYKKDPVADGDDTFNIDTMLNENWDKLDSAVHKAAYIVNDSGTQKYRWGVDDIGVYFETIDDEEGG